MKHIHRPMRSSMPDQIPLGRQVRTATNLLRRTVARITLLTILIISGGVTVFAQTCTEAMTSTATNGNQGWTGLLSTDFTVNSSVTVTKLGAFSFDGLAIANGAWNGAGTGIRVGIYKTNAPNIGFVPGLDVVITAADGLPAPGRFVYQAVSPVVLAPGDYTVVSLGWNGLQRNANTNTGDPNPVYNTGGGAINYVYAGNNVVRYDGSMTWGLPSISYSGASYHAGTFEFCTTAPVHNVTTNQYYTTIQAAIDDVLTTNGDSITVNSAIYNEDVTVNKSVKLVGIGLSKPKVVGPIGGPAATFTIAASNVLIDGFEITRAGNNTTDWNNPGLNTPGIAIQGQAITGTEIRNNLIQGNRTGIDINNSNGHNVHNNTITDNRTGLIFRNQTDNMDVQENFITNNWTVGVLFLDASGGSNSPVQTALNSKFKRNNISGNWYGQVVDRQTGGSLPAPGTTNLKNFKCDWFGATPPVVTTANSAEPGYAAQIPVAYGGSATPPGGQPDIAGPASANIVYQPYLTSGTDADGATYGFQPAPGTCAGCLAGAPVTNTNTGEYYCSIQSAIDDPLTLNGHTISASAGTYAENITVTKSLTILGPNDAIDPCAGGRVAEAIIMPAATQTSVQGSTSGTIFRLGSGSGHLDVTIKGFTLDGHNPTLTNGIVLNGVEVHTGAGIVNSTGSFDANPGGYDVKMIVQNNIIQNLERYGVLADGVPSTAPMAGTDVSHNKIDNIPSGNLYPGGGRGRGIAFEENHYGSATYNCISRVNVGWQDDNYYLPSPGAATVVSNNTISSYHRGIFHNLQYSGASNATISNNTISAESSNNSGTDFGVEIASIQSAVGATVTGNNVTGKTYGLLLWNNPTTSTINVSGGTLTNNGTGIFATETDPQFGPAAASSYGISNITITGGTTGLQVDGNASVTTLSNVAFSGQSGDYIRLSNSAMNGQTLDATTATFGGVTGATATLAQNYAIEDKIVHKLDNATLGFVLVKADNDFVTPLSASIQRGVDAVSSGDTVNVEAGTYAGNVTVDKSLAVLGPNKAVDPCSGPRLGEAIVLPAVTQTSAEGSTSGTIFRLGSGSGHIDVTIKGFLIDGHNPLLTGGVNLNGVDIHTGAGIVNSIGSFDANPGGYNVTMTIQNNIIQNLERYGVLADGVTPVVALAGTDVSHNKIDNIPSGNVYVTPGGGRGRGIAFEENHYGSATFNCISRVNVGWQDDNYYLPSTGAPTTVSNNTISSYHRGIFHNLQYSGASNATISNNTISAESSNNSGTDFGVEIASIQSAVGATVTGNNVTGKTYGLLLWNNPTTSTINVSGGTLTNNGTGIFATETDPQFGPAAASSYGISNITITGGTTGLQVDGNASVTTLSSVAFSGQSGDYIKMSNNAMNGQTLDATNDTFGGQTGASATLAQNFAIEDKITHKIDLLTLGFVRVKANNDFVTVNSFVAPNTAGSIQRGIDVASTGDTVNVDAGTFTENVTVNKRVRIHGAGSTVSGTVVTSAAANTVVMNVTANGLNTSNPVLLDSMRITGATGSGNPASGVQIAPAVAPAQFLSFDNIAAVSNQGHGLSFNFGGTANDITLVNCDLSSNGGTGLRVATSVTMLNGLSITGGSINSNGGIGLSINPSISNGSDATNISVIGTTFSGNGTTSYAGSGLGFGDISFSGVNGNISLTNVTVTGLPSNGAHIGIQFRGHNAPASSGTVTLNNVNVTGSYRRPSLAGSNPGGPGDGILIQNYTNVNGFSFNNVTVNTTDGHAMELAGLTTTLNLGNSGITAQNSNAAHIAIGTSSQNNVQTNADATGCTFNGVLASTATLPQLFAIEDKIVHKIDIGLLGFVLVKANNDYVTPNSFVSPVTTTPSIQRGVDAASTGFTVNVASGSYNEDVAVNKQVTLLGAGYGSTSVSGPIGGPGATMQVTASNAVIDGFAITRDGNNTTDWNNAGLNSAGIAIQGLAITAVEVRNCSLYGNRTGIDINNSNGHNIHNNLIDNNRTGMIFRNQTDNMNVQNNFITNNWTVGVLFLDASGGTNSPLQQALNSAFNKNNISGNWYGDVADRQSGGSLPAPGTTNLKNFTCNWYGTTSPTVTTANTAEPGYAAQIPVAYGGGASDPGGHPNIAGPASANIQYIPYLTSGTDTSATPGFQPGVACSGSCNLVASAMSTDATCASLSNGTATANVVSGGLGGTYQYLWTPTSQTTQTATGLSAGMYNVVVTDSNGCTAPASTTVNNANPSPVATITPSSPSFCSALTLTGGSASGGSVSSYAWTGPAGFAPANTQSINLYVANKDTIYSLVIDSAGCKSAPATYNYQKQNQISSYNIFAIRKVDLYSNNKVVNGSIGVNSSSTGQLFMQALDTLASPGAFVKAPYMSIAATAYVPTRYTAAAVAALPTMNYAVPAVSGGNASVTTSTTLSGNYYDVTIGSGLTVIVDGNSFHAITIGKNSKVTFTAPVVNAYSISTSAGVKIVFSQNTEMRVARSVRLSTGNIVNPSSKLVTFYVGDGNAADEFRTDEGGTIRANAYVPDLGTITVGSSVSAPTTMTGKYIAYQVTSIGKNITWNSFDCSAPPAVILVKQTQEPITSAIETISGFDVRVAPNPSSGIFTFNIVSESTEAASIRIMDVSGRLILNRTIADPGMPIEIGQEMAAGNYFAEIIQGQNKKVLKLTKIE